MICPTCMAASDQRAPRTQHCDDPGCTCGHNTKRYGTVTTGEQTDQPEPRLLVKVFGATPPPCESGRHYNHPGWDCAEQDALAKAWQKTVGDVTIQWLNPPRNPADLAPLRALAAQALGEQPGTVHLDPRANDPAYHPITGYRTWAEVDADPPQFTGLHATLPVETACTATLTSPFGAGTYRCAQPAGHYDDTAEPTFGADGWATDIGGWHAMAGARRCVWADTADGATPHVDTTTED